MENSVETVPIYLIIWTHNCMPSDLIIILDLRMIVQLYSYNLNIRCTHEVCAQTYSWGASALLLYTSVDLSPSSVSVGALNLLEH